MIGPELEWHIFDFCSGHAAEALLTLRTMLVKELITGGYQNGHGKEIIISMGKTMTAARTVYAMRKELKSTVFGQLMRNMGWAKVRIIDSEAGNSGSGLKTYSVGLTVPSPSHSVGPAPSGNEGWLAAFQGGIKVNGRGAKRERHPDNAYGASNNRTKRLKISGTELPSTDVEHSLYLSEKEKQDEQEK